MRDVNWSVYQTLLDARGEKPRPRLAYLDGELEIMTTSRRHETIKKMVARVLEAYVEEVGGTFDGTGSATLQQKDEEAGAEPDESYFVGPFQEFPDLVIEVVQTHGGIDKLEIYRRMNVAEVWFWIDDTLKLYRLVDRQYRAVEESLAIRGIDLAEVVGLVLATEDGQQTESIRAYRATLRTRLGRG